VKIVRNVLFEIQNLILDTFKKELKLNEEKSGENDFFC